jgi:hypothetical protein
MPVSTLITLPRGLFDHAGERHQAAELGPITGYFEAGLAEASELNPEAVSELLARALKRIGEFDEVDGVLTAALARGDRDFALLQLHRGLFGDKLALIVRCDNPSCCQEADLSLRISELARAREAAPETLRVETSAGPVTLREPTGADDAALHGLPKARASVDLWCRLIMDFAGQGPVSPEQWSALPADVRSTVATALADAKSGPTLAFLVPCPSCAAWIEIELDPAELLARQLGIGIDRLFAEVHSLAWAYHWSEHEILSLPRERRWRYLDLIGRQLSGRGS